VTRAPRTTRPRTYLRSFAALLLVALSATAASGQSPRSIEDCERIRGDLAYNQCLAQFGPRVGQRPARASVAPDEVEPQPAVRERRHPGRASVTPKEDEARPAVRERRRASRVVVRRGRVRQTAAFEIRSRSADAAAPAGRQRRRR